MATHLDRSKYTYHADSMRMCEAKTLALATWGANAVVFNGKPDSVVPTYKVGVAELVDGKLQPKWLGVGLDWDRAMLEAGVDAAVVAATGIYKAAAAKKAAKAAAAATTAAAATVPPATPEPPAATETAPEPPAEHLTKKQLAARAKIAAAAHDAGL